MCGIAGYIGKEQIDDGRVRRTLQLMKNRGPDHADYKVIPGDQGHIYLLHSRLSIIDLDPRSNQPFCLEHFSLIYNGEIYNYKEIREELVRRGVIFRTESDTEVLLRAYMEYGEKCVDKFEGMWAFAIYDQKKQALFLSRDRFAEKPLYYFEDGHGFYFASEVKFIGALVESPLRVNYDHLKRYLVNGYKSLYKTPETFFEGVREIPPATNMVLTFDGDAQTYPYWRPQYRPQAMSMDDAIAGFRHHFLNSIKLRLRADVPLAFCLSGGVDSAAIVSAAAKSFEYDVHTFSIIDADERYNERKNIQATLNDLKCKHTIIETQK
ncbi:MAG: asparagine synthase (glutamine-hydrolyzing), partial [Candidatus Omnitrophica bacterium]|nr:asparagine synthase (glutamine-hydrolyzing) [Candidatus Omnitrophota bacterium]